MKCVPVHHGIPAVLHRDEPWLHRHSENGALTSAESVVVLCPGTPECSTGSGSSLKRPRDVSTAGNYFVAVPWQ